MTRVIIIAVAMVALTARMPIAQTCLVAGTATQFGSYDSVTGLAFESTGSISVTCTTVLPASVSYAITLNGGDSGSISNRNLRGLASTLRYQLYTDGARSRIWGDGSGGSFTVSDGYQLPSLGTVSRSYPVYGRLPANQPSLPGIYTDNVVITLTY